MATAEQIDKWLEGKQTNSYFSSSFPQLIPIFGDMAEFVKGNLPTPPLLSKQGHEWYFSDIANYISQPAYWTSIDERIFDLLFAQNHLPYQVAVITHIVHCVYSEGESDVIGFFVEELKKRGMTDKEILEKVIDNRFVNYFMTYNEKSAPTSLGRYILSHFLAFKNELIDLAIETNAGFLFIKLLIPKYEAIVYENAARFLHPQKVHKSERLQINYHIARGLLHFNAARYESFVVEALKHPSLSADNRYNISQLLHRYLPEKYQSWLIDGSLTYLHSYSKEIAVRLEQTIKDKYYYFNPDYGMYDIDLKYSPILSVDATEYLLTHDRERAILILKQFIRTTPAFPSGVLRVIEKHLGKESVGMLVDATKANLNKCPRDFTKTIFELLGKHDFMPEIDRVWEFTKNKSKKIRDIAAVAVSKLGEAIIPRAAELLKEKKRRFSTNGRINTQTRRHRDSQKNSCQCRQFREER
jgi:hypothetical protein